MKFDVLPALYEGTREFSEVCRERVHQQWWTLPDLDIRQVAARYHSHMVNAAIMNWFQRSVEQRISQCLGADHYWDRQTSSKRCRNITPLVYNHFYYQLPAIVRDEAATCDQFCQILPCRADALTDAFYGDIRRQFEALSVDSQQRFLQRYPRSLRDVVPGLEGLRKQQQRLFARFVTVSNCQLSRDSWWPAGAWA